MPFSIMAHREIFYSWRPGGARLRQTGQRLSNREGFLRRLFRRPNL